MAHQGAACSLGAFRHIYLEITIKMQFLQPDESRAGMGKTAQWPRVPR